MHKRGIVVTLSVLSFSTGFQKRLIFIPLNAFFQFSALQMRKREKLSQTVAHTAIPNLTTHVSYCKSCAGRSFLALLESRVLDLATISLAGPKVVLKLLQQSSLLSPSGQSLFLVVFGGRDLALLLA